MSSIDSKFKLKMKSKKPLHIDDASIKEDLQPLVKIAGLIDLRPTFYGNTKGRNLQNEGSFLLNISKGTLSNQTGFEEFLGHSNKLSVLKDLVAICFKKHLPLLKHLILTFKKYHESHFPVERSAVLNLTCRIKKGNNSFIKLLFQVSVYESHENQLTKLMIKFIDIDFISSSCDMAWTLQSNKEQEIVFKKMVAEKFSNEFTSRELEIVNQMQFSLNNSEIGNILFISSHTVATHRKNLYKKSGLHSTNDLISYCRERGLI